MNTDILESVIFVGGILWLFYRYFKTKKERPLFVALLAICLLLTRWPLFLPIQATLSLWSFLAAAALFNEHYRKKSKEYSLAYFYILFFVGFGCIFLVEAISQKYFK